MPSVESLSHSAELVRRLDRERFVTALFAPPETREGLMVLYAFNTEIATVREVVREPMAGLVRLQWWREVTAGVRHPERHPVATPLVEQIVSQNLPVALFEALLTARERDLYPEPPEDMAAAEAYAEATGGGLAALAVRLLGATEAGGETEMAARHVGTAWSLLGQLRALPFVLSTGRLTLPVAVLHEAGTSPEAVLAGRKEGLNSAVERVVSHVQGHLAAARRLSVKPQALPALLPGTVADLHLRMLAKTGYDVFDRRVAIPRANPLRLAFARWRRRF